MTREYGYRPIICGECRRPTSGCRCCHLNAFEAAFFALMAAVWVIALVGLVDLV